MKAYEFNVVASGLDPQAADYESLFYETGGEDAMVSFRKGRTVVDVSREAECRW